jgi:dihydroorotase
LVLIDPNAPWTVKKDNIDYKCGWSPFEGTTFKNRVTHTIVNGVIAYENGKFPNRTHGERLIFNRA